MNLAEQIEQALRQQKMQGKTQTELSELNGISQSHVQRILANPGKKIRGLKVETIMKMFPDAELILYKKPSNEETTMPLAKQVENALNEERERGMKQTEMAKLHNVSQQYICRLLAGKRSCGDITLKTLEKMFPLAKLSLNRAGNDTQVASNGQESNINSSFPSNTKSAEMFRQEAIAALIRLDISGDDLKLVLNALMELKT